MATLLTAPGYLLFFAHREIILPKVLTLLNFTTNFEKLIAFAIESELSSTQSKLFEPHFSPIAKKSK